MREPKRRAEDQCAERNNQKPQNTEATVIPAPCSRMNKYASTLRAAAW